MNTNRPFSLSLYLLLVIALSWPFQIAGQLWAASISMLVLCNGTSMIMVAVATVYHATYDGFRDSIGVTLGLGPLAGLWANALLIAGGIVLLWKADWSMLSENPVVTKVQPEPEPIHQT